MSEKRFKKFGSAEEFNSLLDYAFVNYDGTVLQSGKLVKGETPTYNGETPTRPKEGSYRYDFIGWSPEIGPIRQDMQEFVAQYEKVLDAVTVRFLNYDGTVLQTSQVEIGETPTYTGETPTRESTAQYAYTFDGWSPEIGPVSEATDYTAQYESEVRDYTVTYKASDGVTVIDTETVAYGGTPKFYDAINKSYGYETDEYHEYKLAPAKSTIVADTVYTMTLTDIPHTLIRATGGGKVEYFETKGYFRLQSDLYGVIIIADKDENGGDWGVSGQTQKYGEECFDYRGWLMKNYSPRKGFHVPEIEEWYIFDTIVRDIYQNTGDVTDMVMDLNLYYVYSQQLKDEGYAPKYRARPTPSFWSRSMTIGDYEYSDKDKEKGAFVTLSNPDGALWNIEQYQSCVISDNYKHNLRLFYSTSDGIANNVIPLRTGTLEVNKNNYSNYADGLFKMPDWRTADFQLAGMNISNRWSMGNTLRVPITFIQPNGLFFYGRRFNEIRNCINDLKSGSSDSLDMTYHIPRNIGFNIYMDLSDSQSWITLNVEDFANKQQVALYKRNVQGQWNQTINEISIGIYIDKPNQYITFTGRVYVVPQRGGSPFQDNFTEHISFSEIERYIPNFRLYIESSDYIYNFPPLYMNGPGYDTMAFTYSS